MQNILKAINARTNVLYCKMYRDACTYVFHTNLINQCHSYNLIGESSIDFHQYWREFSGVSPIGESAGVHWSKFSGFSPIGESAEGVLVKVQWPFANGESSLGENLIGEERVSRL